MYFCHHEITASTTTHFILKVEILMRETFHACLVFPPGEWGLTSNNEYKLRFAFSPLLLDYHINNKYKRSDYFFVFSSQDYHINNRITRRRRLFTPSHNSMKCSFNSSNSSNSSSSIRLAKNRRYQETVAVATLPLQAITLSLFLLWFRSA